MSTPKWHEQPLVAFDTETSGTNPAEARIITAAAVHLTVGQRPRPLTWVLNPGVDIPDEAAAVHGYTTDRLNTLVPAGRALRTLNGVTSSIPIDAAVFEITGQVAATIGRGHALIVHNAAYDLTLLEHEAARHGVDPISARPAGYAGVVDPMVIEKAYDPFRKMHKDAGGCRGGKHRCGGCGAVDKKLESLCTHYGVRHAGAHDAADDAIAAARLARKLVEAWPEMARWKLATLHEHQVTWRREQANSLRSYFDRNGIEHDGVDPGWPTYTTTPATVAALRTEAAA